MNKDRRKALTTLIDRIEQFNPHSQGTVTVLQEFRESLTPRQNDVASIREALEALRDEEQESYDNLSENLQQSERGQKLQDAVSEMETAISSLQTIEDKLEELLDALGETATDIYTEANDAIQSIDNARGQQ